jgi:protein SCO1/2
MNTNSGRSGRRALPALGWPVWLLAAPVAVALALVAGCSKPAGSSGESGAAAAQAAGEKRYPLTGEILKVIPERRTLLVMHDEIPGFMSAMAMEFTVSEGDAAIAKEGQKIRGELVAPAGGGFRLEKIWPNDKVAVDTVTAAEKKLREDTHNLGKNVYNGDPEDTPPNFVLYNQDGRVVQSTGFRGKQVMLNFIYTRCPDQTMCPAATMKMATVQRLAREAGVANLELVSITMDTAYDTPGVLKEYAKSYGIDTANFSFLTGPESAVRDLLTQFAVATERTENILRHTLATVLIDANGKIVHRTDGRAWEPQDFVAKMKKT